MAGNSGTTPIRTIQGKIGHGKPALDPNTLLALRDRATPEDFEAVRDRLLSDGARFWFDLVTPKARWLSVVDLAAVAEWCNAEGEREYWQQDVVEARKTGKPVLSQYMHNEKNQALGNGALAKRYSEDCERLRNALGFTPAAAARIREIRQLDLFGQPEQTGDGATPPENPAVSRLDALRGKLGIVNGGLATG